MPLLSIIMPVYNAEKFLYKSLSSVLKQSFVDWELVLINDGSTDASHEICEEFAKSDNRIRVINKKNEGAGPARNVGLAEVKGKYVTFLDSDDWLDREAYRVCIEKIVEKDVDLLVFGMLTKVYDNVNDEFEQEIPQNIPKIELNTQKECRENWLLLYKEMDMGSPCNKIYKREIIEKYDIKYPPLRRMQDGVFNMYYFDKIHSFMSIPNNFYIRRWHSAEFQRKKMPKDFIECAITHHKTMMTMLAEWGALKEEAKLYFGNHFSEIVMTAEFDYLPEDNPSWLALYKHIKKINNNSYIHSFYKEYKTYNAHFRKKELAMLNGWNILLATDTYLKQKKG